MSLDIMVENIQRVLEIHRSGKSAAESYKELCEEIPGLKELSKESFRVYLRAIDKYELKFPIANQCDKEQLLKLSGDLAVAIQKINELSMANGKLTNQLSGITKTGQPEISHNKLANCKIAGWNVTPWRGYFRAFRRFNGKLHSVYIGRHLEAAEEKIHAREAAIKAHGAGSCIP